MHLLDSFFMSLDEASCNISTQVIVIDNNSTDGSKAILEKYRDRYLLIMNDVNVGFGRANNQALKHLQGEYVLLLNTDAFLERNSLLVTIDWMKKHQSIAILGVKLVNNEGELQPSARFFPNPINLFLNRIGFDFFDKLIPMVDQPDFNFNKTISCDWVPGCFLLTRKKIIDELGLFDPRFFMYYEEVDFCKKVKSQGGNVVYYPETTVKHIGGESAKGDFSLTSQRQVSKFQLESEVLYIRKNQGLLLCVLHLILLAVGDLIIIFKSFVKKISGTPNIQTNLMFSKTAKKFFKTHLAKYPTR